MKLTPLLGLHAQPQFVIALVLQSRLFRRRKREIRLRAIPLIFGGRSICGSLTGTLIDGEGTLAFSVLENICPVIDAVPLEQAADAYARMMEGKARFRMALVTKDGIV